MHDKSYKRYFVFTLAALIVLSWSCREKYVANVKSPTTGYLVLEGVVNINGDSHIRLSRTTGLTDQTVEAETSATVQLQGNDNSTFDFAGDGAGNYTLPQTGLNTSVKYRLHINAGNGKEYVSDFEPLKNTPPIDSLSWTRNNDGVTISVNAHDAADTTRYYLWDYLETWEFHSPFETKLNYFNDGTIANPLWHVGFRDSLYFSADLSLQICWQSEASTKILLGSTAKLTHDVVYLPLVPIPAASRKLSVLYSVHVNQYAITEGAYNYLQKIKKNSEQVGSVFDPQPSELSGNIHCVSDPNEQVIGYFSICAIRDFRLFIKNNDVPDWNYKNVCPLFDIQNQPDSVAASVAMGYLPTIVSKFTPFGGIVSFSASPAICVDCTLSGTNVKPSFWPN